MTIKDRRGRTRTIIARLVEDDPPSFGGHYEATVGPSKSGRHYRGHDGEPLERFMGRIIGELRGQQR